MIRHRRTYPDEAKEIVKAIVRRRGLTEDQEYKANVYRTLGDLARLLDIKGATLRRAVNEGRLDARRGRGGGWWRTTLRAVAGAIQRGYKGGWGEQRGGMTVPDARRWIWKD